MPKQVFCRPPPLKRLFKKQISDEKSSAKKNWVILKGKLLLRNNFLIHRLWEYANATAMTKVLSWKEKSIHFWYRFAYSLLRPCCVIWENETSISSKATVMAQHDSLFGKHSESLPKANKCPRILSACNVVVKAGQELCSLFGSIGIQLMKWKARKFSNKANSSTNYLSMSYVDVCASIAIFNFQCDLLPTSGVLTITTPSQGLAAESRRFMLLM